MFHPTPPLIKEIDTRCSTKCVKNWTNYKQRVPVGHFCSCSVSTKNCLFIEKKLISKQCNILITQQTQTKT
jgi:hypothetical protein